MDDDIFFNNDAAQGRIFGGLNYEEPFAQATASRAPLDVAAGGLGAYQSAYDMQSGALDQYFTRAEEMLRERLNRGEDKGARMERLLTLAAALGQPTRTGSFGEQLGNFNKALVSGMQGRRERRQALEDKLFELQQDKALTLAKLKAQAMMQGMKPRARRTAFNPVTGVLTDLDTGLPFEGGAAAPETLPADFFGED